MSFPVLCVSSAVLVACGDNDPFRQDAFVENVDRQYQVWALTGTPAALPAGYQFTTESLVRPQVLGGGSLNFDVAFDLTADGKVAVLPARLLSPLPPGGAPPIGVQRWIAAYEQLLRAPDRGYTLDTTAVLAVGETISIQLPNSGCTFGEPFYAKLTIDDVDMVQRSMLVRTLVNRNCGFRALSAGLPKD